MVLVNKPWGSTPLQVIRWYQHNTGMETTPMTYAGRLDPLAQGLLLILVGEERYHKDEYLQLPKTYTLSVLLGVETDTGDLLGIPTIHDPPDDAVLATLYAQLQRYVGSMLQPYPRYSAKPVAGKPLFVHARQGIEIIPLPTKEVAITALTIEEKTTVSATKLVAKVQQACTLVDGDFRQAEIRSVWQTALKPQASYPVVTLTVSCSSGTYMRSLATRIGQDLGCGGCAYDIIRTAIGPFDLSMALSVPPPGIEPGLEV